MQSKQTIITLVGAAILLLFALAVISFVPPAPTIHALAPSLQDDPQPHVGFDTLDDSVPAGEYAYAGLLFASFPCIDQNNDNKCNHKDKFTTVTYRFDILQGGADADNCEGQGLGSVRNFSPSYYDSWRTSGPSPLRIARNCPTGAYTMKCTVTYTEPGSDVAIPIACNSRDFTVGPPRSQDPPTATPTEIHTDGDAHRNAHTDGDAHRNAHTDGDAHRNAHTDGDAHRNAHTDGDAHRNAHTDGHAHRNAHTDGDAHRNAHTDGHTHRNTHTDGHTHRNTHTDGHTHRNVHTDGDAHRNVHINRHAHRNSHTNRHAHKHGHTDRNADR